MEKRHWIGAVVAGFVIVVLADAADWAIMFQNRMVSLQEMKKAEIETTKVEYGQCIVKILETNQVAKSYRDDVLTLADKAGSNLGQFNHELLALVTQVIPQMSSDLRETVQRQIITCRNAYTGRVDLNLKPMYVAFNQEPRQFPNNVFNALFFHWQPDELILPKNEAGDEIFRTGKIKPLDLN